jgi:NAD(P)-dependent dehydrogenase (short-subunit alcohol dehydrogenase family)
MSEQHEHGAVDWKIHGIKVIPGDQLDPNTAQTPGMDRAAAITRSLAVAYAAQKVRVNAIAPSATMTERVKSLVAGNANLQKLADSHLVGLIEPGDIANCALYLASDEARMVTGQVIPVDSGVTIS